MTVGPRLEPWWPANSKWSGRASPSVPSCCCGARLIRHVGRLSHGLARGTAQQKSAGASAGLEVGRSSNSVAGNCECLLGLVHATAPSGPAPFGNLGTPSLHRVRRQPVACHGASRQQAVLEPLGETRDRQLCRETTAHNSRCLASRRGHRLRRYARRMEAALNCSPPNMGLQRTSACGLAAGAPRGSLTRRREAGSLEGGARRRGTHDGQSAIPRRTRDCRADGAYRSRELQRQVEQAAAS
jgi:hypothetical protein